MADSDYQPQSVLITGGAGFICSHLCNYLINKYPNVKFVCLDILDYCSNLKNLYLCRAEDNPNEWKPNFKFVKGSILNTDLVSLLLQDYHIDTVLHFAAQSHVDRSFGNSLEFTQTNVLGTHVLLECSKRYNVKRFVHVSTDEVYGEIPSGLADEMALLSPTNPYSCSKAGAEFVCQAYIRSFHLPIIITRGNNVFGPMQFPEKVIPKFILRLHKGLKCCIHGSGEGSRNFIHTSDVVKAFDIILHKGVLHEIYNIGTRFEISVMDLAKKIIKYMKGKDQNDLDPSTWIEHVPDRAFNDCRYRIDSTKLVNLGWNEPFSEELFDTQLHETIDWYINHLDWWSHDINSYLDPHPIAYKTNAEE